jgi:hypothetical protein
VTNGASGALEPARWDVNARPNVRVKPPVEAGSVSLG